MRKSYVCCVNSCVSAVFCLLYVSCLSLCRRCMSVYASTAVLLCEIRLNLWARAGFGLVITASRRRRFVRRASSPPDSFPATLFGCSPIPCLCIFFVQALIPPISLLPCHPEESLYRPVSTHPLEDFRIT